MCLLPLRDVFELYDGKVFDKLLDNNSIINKSILFQNKFSIDLLNDKLRITLYSKSSNSYICKAEMSFKTRASYPTSLLKQQNSNLKDKETLMP